MAQLPQRFNVADAPEDEYEVIQPGSYVAIITESDIEANKAGDGAFIKFKYQLENGRTLFDRLNIQNKSEKTVEIAYKTLKKICDACGKTSIADTTELHNIRFRIDVEVEKGGKYMKDGVEKQDFDQNKIKRYYSLNKAAPAVTQEKSNDDSALPPWKRK